MLSRFKKSYRRILKKNGIIQIHSISVSFITKKGNIFFVDFVLKNSSIKTNKSIQLN